MSAAPHRLTFEDLSDRHQNRSKGLAEFLAKVYTLRKDGADLETLWTLIDDLARQISTERHRVNNMEDAFNLFFFGDLDYGFPSKLQQLQTTIEEGFAKIVGVTTKRQDAMEKQLLWLKWGMGLVGAAAAITLGAFITGLAQHLLR